MKSCCGRTAIEVGRGAGTRSGVRGLGLLLLGLLTVCGCRDSSSSQGPPQVPPTPAPGAGRGVKTRPEPQDAAGARSAAERGREAGLGRLGEALAGFNRGAALIEQYQYTRAAEVFEKVLELAPDWTAARYNLGLAYYNMHGVEGAEQNLENARRAFEAVLAADPEHLPARFCLGLYHQHLGNDEEALECFQAVSREDEADAHVAYKCAEALIALGRNDEGTAMLEKTLKLDPGFVSAVYRLALQYARRGQRDKATPLFERFQELRAAELAGGSFTVGKAYGSAGKYYRALGPDSLPLRPAERTQSKRVVFSPEIVSLDARAESWRQAGWSVDLPGIATGDVDGDGDLDLCLTALGPQGHTALWLNDGRGRFSPPERIASQGVSPCFGDVDNDGDLDLWLGRAGTDVLWENDGQGHFRRNDADVLRGPEALTAAARLADLDSDGDLDLLAFRLARGSIPAAEGSQPAASSVYNNNRDGSFSDLAAELGLSLPQTPVAAVVYDDFDNDRDLDLVIFPAGGRQPVAWINDRVGKFRVRGGDAAGLAISAVRSATSGDPDKDGDRDLLVFAEDGVRLYVNQGGFRFKADRAFGDSFRRLGGTGGQFADMDNDGDLDLVIADAHRRDGTRGPALLLNDWPRARFLDVLALDPGHLFGTICTEGNASCVVADFTGNARCDVLLAPVGAMPALLENVTPGGHWIELDLCGTRPRDNKARSNCSAIGARVEIKTGTVLQQYVVGVPSGPVAMPPLRIHAGLGENPKLDWLRILWPDAVLQAELELAADRRISIAEMPRKTSSCPYLFAWNGSRFQFVSDFGGVGGLGYFVAPGGYAPPDPTEYLRIEHLRALGGEYTLQVLTALEEVTYFDEAKLIAVDHPQGTHVYPNEMMAVNLAPPAFELFCFREPIDPVRAVDHRGVDVREAILRTDRRYAGATRPDERFLGLAEDHFLELDFGNRLRELSPGGRWVLFLYGWVEYGYSSSNFAADQAGLRAKAPSIHAMRDGKWVELFREVGYPAGVQHMMTLEVTGKILRSDRRIRISSNMELYWDRVFLAEHLPDEALSLREVPASRADLHYLGYPREYSPDGCHPNLCDYDNLDRTVAWKLMTGRYTRYGGVAELLREADDCYVIMGHGEELTLGFAADALGPVPEGRRRSFILRTDSYCKDMDLCTACPDTVEPLPFHGMSGYPYGPDEHYPDDEPRREYRRRFNTRHVRAR